jgi:hypothetical protein
VQVIQLFDCLRQSRFGLQSNPFAHRKDLQSQRDLVLDQRRRREQGKMPRQRMIPCARQSPSTVTQFAQE